LQRGKGFDTEPIERPVAEQEESSQEEPPPVTLTDFLQNVPPSTMTAVTDLAVADRYTNGIFRSYVLAIPPLVLRCNHEVCQGPRIFRHRKGRPDLNDDDGTNCFMTYICSNCQEREKIYSLWIRRTKDASSGHVYKFGELPEYGPHTPGRLITLIGPDREMFLKGRRSEIQGLGIGAFGYYRRVVENQKIRILDEVIRAAQKLRSGPVLIEQLKAAQRETQFSKAIEVVKAALPESLLIDGHNPLSLLHSALSDGLHDRTDEHCLQLAHNIRVVLTAFSERLAQALKDEAELHSAVSQLLNAKSGDSSSKGDS
jgi:hypothetical protein